MSAVLHHLLGGLAWILFGIGMFIGIPLVLRQWREDGYFLVGGWRVRRPWAVYGCLSVGAVMGVGSVALGVGFLVTGHMIHAHVFH